MISIYLSTSDIYLIYLISIHSCRYEGSLTTPGCNEIVTWSVLRHAAAVSEQQLHALRSLLDGEGHTMGDNYR